MTDAELMAKIRTELGDYIAGAVEGTSFPPALLAALVANESGGTPCAARFEPDVLGEFARVIAHQKLSFAPAGIKKPIAVADLNGWIDGTASPALPGALLRLINLATSWGPTQIMGWHALEMGFNLSELTNLATHFERTVELLEWFQKRYTLDIPLAGADEIWAQYFHCWNTGSPVAPTYDPHYVSNGLNRMHLYASAG